MRILLLAALVAAVSGSAAYAAPDAGFDKGLDAGAFLSKAKEAAKADAAPVQAAQFGRTDRDCATFTFAPDGPTVSDRVWLRSTEYEQVCTPAGDPRRGGGVWCHEEPRWTHTELVQLELRGRGQLYPWEREVFEACLDGSWLNVYALRTSYDYRSSQSGGYFTLTAGARHATDPDPAGITADAPVQTAKAFTAAFHDRWASYYAGETVRLKVALKRDIPIFPDVLVVEKEVELPAAESYKVDFNAYLGEFKEALKAGKEYHVEFGFTRLGRVSKQTFMKGGETPKVKYAPAGALEVASLD